MKYGFITPQIIVEKYSFLKKVKDALFITTFKRKKHSTFRVENY